MNSRQQLLEQIRQQSIQKRAQALREAAQKAVFNTPIVGASGSGSGSRSGCLPAGGVSLTIQVDGSVAIFKVFLYPENAIINDRPVYLSQSSFNEFEKGYIYYLSYQISWNGIQWELNLIGKENDTIDFQELLATSSELYSTDWTIDDIKDITVIESTVPGEEFSCDWRYCTTTNEGSDYVAVAPLIPGWYNIEFDQYPNTFIGIELPEISWDEKDSSWVTVDNNDEIVLLGGSRTQLPIGTFDLGNDTLFTIQQGVCGF